MDSPSVSHNEGVPQRIAGMGISHTSLGEDHMNARCAGSDCSVAAEADGWPDDGPCLSWDSDGDHGQGAVAFSSGACGR